MTLTNIVRYINGRLAGEILTYSELQIHMDAVIDEINAKLNSTFPVFSEFTVTDYPVLTDEELEELEEAGEEAYQHPDYTFFPDKYIRSVVVVGAAFKFYLMDEEGINAAPLLEQEYARNLFYMERDYSDKVPTAFQAETQGYFEENEDYIDGVWVDMGSMW